MKWMSLIKACMVTIYNHNRTKTNHNHNHNIISTSVLQQSGRNFGQLNISSLQSETHQDDNDCVAGDIHHLVQLSISTLSLAINYTLSNQLHTITSNHQLPANQSTFKLWNTFTHSTNWLRIWKERVKPNELRTIRAKQRYKQGRVVSSLFTLFIEELLFTEIIVVSLFKISLLVARIKIFKILHCHHKFNISLQIINHFFHHKNIKSIPDIHIHSITI